MYRDFGAAGGNSPDIIQVPMGGDAPAHVIVPDARLLFTASYKKAGPDLVLTGEDGHKLVLTDYFRAAHRANLFAPDGAVLTGDLVAQLAGPDAPAQIAQAAGAPAGAKLIGRVEKVSGTATVQRANGMTVELKVGDYLYQGDVVQTSQGSALGLSLADGTAFNMGAGARMVLNELVYDANGTNNSALVNLVQGSITFVAGKIAKTGDMKVETPAATMGIRGTTGNWTIEATLGTTTFVLIPDQDGTAASAVDVFNKLTGQLLLTYNNYNNKLVISPGSGGQANAATVPLSPGEVAALAAAAQLVFQVYNQALADPYTTQSQNSPSGSSNPSDAPNLLKINISPLDNQGGNGFAFAAVGPNGEIANGGVQVSPLSLFGSSLAVSFIDPLKLFQQVPPIVDQNTLTSTAPIVITDVGGTPGFDFAALLAAGWIDLGDGLYGHMGSFGTATLNANAAPLSAATLTAAGWTAGANGVFSKSVSLGGNVTTVSVTLTPSAVTYWLDNDKALHLGGGQQAQESFPITVKDEQGSSVTTSVPFTIVGANDPASIGGPTSGGVTEDVSIQSVVSGTLTIQDVDNGETHFQAVPAAALVGTYGAFTFDPATGAWTYTVDHAKADHLADGVEVHDKLTVSSSDGTDSRTIDITVTGTNDGATITGEASGAVIEQGQAVTVGGTLVVHDVDDGEAVFQAIGGVAPGNQAFAASAAGSPLVGQYGDFTFDATTGAWTYTLDPAKAAALTEGEQALDTLTVTSFDGTDSKTIKVDITGTNDGATITASGDEDTAVSEAGGLANYTPGDATASGRLTVHDLDAGEDRFQPPASLTGDYGTFAFDATTGVWSYALDQAKADALTDGEPATDTLTVTSADGTASYDIVVHITGSNDAATVTGSHTDTAKEDVDITAGGALTVHDVDTGQASFQAVPAGALVKTYGSFTFDATSGAWTYALDHAKADHLADGVEVHDYLTVTSLDGTAQETIDVAITGSNDAPTVDAITRSVGEDGPALSVDLLAAANPNDVDGDALSVANADTSIVTAGGRTLVLGTDYTLTGTSFALTPAGFAKFNGLDTNETDTFTLHYQVTDGHDPVANALTVTVDGANDPPTFDSIVRSVSEDGPALSVDLLTAANAGDPDIETLAVANPDGAVTTDGGVTLHLGTDYTIAGAAFALTTAGLAKFQNLDLGDSDHFTLHYQVTDGTASLPNTLGVTVTGANDGPVAHADTGVAGENETKSFDVVADDTDVDSSGTRTLTALGAVVVSSADALVNGIDAAGAFSIVGGQVKFTPGTLFDALDHDDTATVVVHYTIQDEHGAPASSTLTLTVNGANDAPVINGVAGTVAVPEDSPRILYAPAGAIVDVDAGGDDMVVSLSVAHGTLGPAGPTPGLTFVDADGSDGTISVKGSLAAVNAALTGGVLYSPTTDYNGPDVLTLNVSDGHGGSDTAQIGIDVTPVNDAPVVGTGAASVSEEGLPGSNPDTGGNPDTTNSKTASGTLGITDVDSATFSVTLGNPGAGLTSGGQALVWSGVGTQTLTGKVGATTIFTATIDKDGTYTVTLWGPIDHPAAGEDARTLIIPVGVSDGSATTPTTIAVSIEDDAPVANAAAFATTEFPGVDTNIMLIIDTSGSMNDPSGLTNLSRLDLLKASVHELLDQYDNLGDVKVQIVTFNTGASQLGSWWLSADQARALVNGLSAGGSTNYDAALTAALAAFDALGKIDGAQNVSYFLSDGEPTTSPTALHLMNWLDTVKLEDIDSFALGIGTGISAGSLNPIAYDGRGAGTDTNGTVVTDPTQLVDTLVGTVAQTITGNLISGALSSFGADGGYIRAIGAGVRTYTYDAAANTLSDDNGGALDNASFNFSTHVLTIANPGAGTLAIDMDDGLFTYTAPVSVNGDLPVSFEYTLVDRDGDTDASTLTITVHNVDRAPLVRDDRVVTNVSGSGASVAIPYSALLYNDADPDGQPIAITGFPNASGGALSSPSADVIAFTDSAPSGGSFAYTGLAGGKSDTGLVTVDRSQAGQSVLDGTGLGDILIGRNGAADTLIGYAGNDVLVGGTGNDTLNGGSGKDMFVFRPGDGSDTISDFEHGVDKVDLTAFDTLTEDDLQSLLSSPGHTINLPAAGSITFANVNVNVLSALDFVIHPHAA